MFEGAFVDTRLDRRGEQILKAMIEKQSAVVHQCCSSHAEQIGAYRFFRNSAVSEAALIAASARHCQPQVRGRHVLAIQDTTSLNIEAHTGRLRAGDSAIGPATPGGQTGFFLHPTLVMDAEQAFPLGLAHVEVWNRSWQQPTKQERQYKSQPFAAKESARWVRSVRRSAPWLAEASRVTVVADRESDVYEVLAQVPDARTDVVLRVAQNRCVSEEPGRLFAVLATQPVQARYSLELRGNATRQARTATIELRWCPVTLHCPASRAKSLVPELPLWALEARETASSVPAGEKPVLWRILTTHALEQPDAARQVIQWYRCRWFIEELFRVLKRQGFQVEAAQLGSGAALRKLCLMALCAALPVMQLTLERDGHYGLAASVVFAESERRCLEGLGPTLAGATVKQQNPFVPGTLAWSAWIIGRLGGWKGYRSQAPPGYITMKRGMERFALTFAGWQLAQGQPHIIAPGIERCQGKDVYKE